MDDDYITPSERQSMMPGNYFMNTITNNRPAPVDASFGILANSFGAPKPGMIAIEDDLMLRTTALSRCGRVPARVHADEVKASMTAASDDAPVSKGTPLTEYLTRARKACTPVYTITNDRIADPSILLRDPHSAVLHEQFYQRPADIGLAMRDEFRKCERLAPRKYDSAFAM